ncbi:MAG: hypothetical protein ACLFR7_08140 [Opitutales bacterium]
MRIDPPNSRDKLGLSGPIRRKPGAEAGATKENASVEDQIALAQIHNMVDQLISQPEVRQPMLELGRQLVADPQYPPREVVERVAEILHRAMKPREA